MPRINDEKKLYNKNMILETASKLFSQYGYNRTSVNDIISHAGISKGRFYTYFDTKEDLFFLIVDNVDASIREVNFEFTDLGEYIEHRLERFFEQNNRIKAQYTLEFWSSATLNEKQKILLDNRYNEFQNDILAVIQRGQKRGIYNTTVNINSYIHVLMAAIDGLIMLDCQLNQPITKDIIETTIDVFISFISKKVD